VKTEKILYGIVQYSMTVILVLVRRFSVTVPIFS
jgi:hypothetical protein